MKRVWLIPSRFFVIECFEYYEKTCHCGKLEKEMNALKLIIEKHDDGYIAYPIGLKGVVIGQGETYDEALADINSAIRFHIETFGDEAFENDSPVLEAFVAETRLAA